MKKEENNMKGYAMLKIGESGWIEKDRPVCGPMDAICRPLAVAICTSDVHTLWEGAIGERHNMILGHECCAEIVETGELVKDFKPRSIRRTKEQLGDFRRKQNGYIPRSGQRRNRNADGQ